MGEIVHGTLTTYLGCSSSKDLAKLSLVLVYVNVVVCLWHSHALAISTLNISTLLSDIQGGDSFLQAI